jgi:hypothetical protein
MSHTIKFNNVTEFNNVETTVDLDCMSDNFHQWKTDEQRNSVNKTKGKFMVTVNGSVQTHSEIEFGDGVLGAVLAVTVKLIFAIRAARRKQS